ncbi:unnamed protein product, partial [Oncorhynchus mykiss]
FSSVFYLRFLDLIGKLRGQIYYISLSLFPSPLISAPLLSFPVLYLSLPLFTFTNSLSFPASLLTDIPFSNFSPSPILSPPPTPLYVKFTPFFSLTFFPHLSSLPSPSRSPLPPPSSSSMGYCILVAHGLGRLCSVVGRWGTTALTVSTLLLLLLFSWKTVQQNDIWLSREALFRSGIQTLPHNAKVHYNYANFLKDRGRHQEAIHHYKTALRSVIVSIMTKLLLFTPLQICSEDNLSVQERIRVSLGVSS